MREKMKKLSSLLAAVMICVMASPLVTFAADAEEYVPKMYASIWSLVPPVVAIALALITKEVYSSLFVGILVGGMFYSGFSFEGTITHIFQEGIVGVLSDSYNVGILIFLVILGTMVCLMNKAGGSAAFGEWASTHIKSRVGAQLATIILGVLIFTILMMIVMVVMKVEYGPMKVHEDNAKKGDIYTTPDRPYANTEEAAVDNCKGKVMDLLIPIISLIICCVIGMIYTGGFFDGVGFVEAFSGSDASQGLVYGSFFAFVITIVLYLVRRVLKFDECMACLPDGFKAMVPAILILVFAWTLKSMTDSLGAAEYVAGIVAGSAEGMVNLLPAIIFLVGCFLAFATGTSWGTFGILIPIVVHAFEGKNETMMIIAISACMAGAVCGDHCSPISDTTIMASAGAQCNHINHVNTQLPYAASCAVISFITYIIAGFVQSAWIALPAGIIMMLAFVTFMKFSQKKQTAAFSQKKEA